MKSIVSKIAIVELAMTAVSGAAVSRTPLINIVPVPGVAEVNPMNAVIDNFSSLFGWQLAGYATNAEFLTPICSDISSVGNGKWGAMGLDPSMMKAAICSASSNGPDPQTSIVNSIHYNSEMFTTQLLSSFNSTEQFTYLCNNLDYGLVESFPVVSDQLIGAACAKAGMQRPPRTFGTKQAKSEAVEAARNTASISFANVFATGATSATELANNCKYAGGSFNNVNAEQLNGTLVESTLCSITEPINVDDATTTLTSWQSRYYTTVLESIGTSDDWLKWLCNNLNADGMSSVGLNGGGVWSQVCSDSWVGSGSTLVSPVQ